MYNNYPYNPNNGNTARTITIILAVMAIFISTVACGAVAYVVLPDRNRNDYVPPQEMQPWHPEGEPGNLEDDIFLIPVDPDAHEPELMPVDPGFGGNDVQLIPVEPPSNGIGDVFQCISESECEQPNGN